MKAYAEHIILLLTIALSVAPLYAGNENKGQTTVPAGQNPTKGHNHDDVPVNSAHLDDFSILPGQSRTLELWMSYGCTWRSTLISFTLPEGLELAEMTSDELDPDAFTFEHVARSVDEFAVPVAGKCEFALSTSLADRRFWSERAIEIVDRWYTGSYPFRTKRFQTDLIVGDHEILLSNADWMTMQGFYPIAQLKVRATEALPQEAYIQLKVGIVGNMSNYVFSDERLHIDGTPTQARVTRRPSYTIDDLNALTAALLHRGSSGDYTPQHDINGDGVADIDDVNAMVNSLIKGASIN